MKKISHTGITAYNSCTLQYYYMYNLRLGPREKPLPLYRGIVGHKALEAYYRRMQDGFPVEECRTTALDVITSEIDFLAAETPWEIEKLGELNRMYDRIEAYSEFYRAEPFEVISVEEEFSALLKPDVEMHFIPDLIVRYIKGKFAGELAVIDHKFSYNFKTPDELRLDAQLPKYKKALQQLGYNVNHIVFNQLRTRDLKNPKPADIFRRSEHYASDRAVDIIWEEQQYTADRISENRPPVRALAPMVCKGCWYKDPCTASMEGHDITNILNLQYEPRERPAKEAYSD